MWPKIYLLMQTQIGYSNLEILQRQQISASK